MTVSSGVYPVIATPFNHDMSPDEEGLRAIIRYVIDAGAHGVTYPAVASEFYSLSDRERLHLSEVVIDEVGGKIPVIIATTAPSIPLAVEFSIHAEKNGADAIMAMAPYVIKESFTGIKTYYREISDAINIPIVLQNAPAPLGSSLSVENVLSLVEEIPRIEFIKEENIPCGQRITHILDKTPSGLKGVFGGAGGRYMIDELNRGCFGVMPACELTEVHVIIYNWFKEGQKAKARSLYNRLLPLLNFQAVFRMAMTKEVLLKRNIISCALVRTGATVLDTIDRSELYEMLAEIDDLLIKLS